MEDTHYTFDDSEVQSLSTGCANLEETLEHNTNGGDTTIPRGKGKEREELVSKDVDHIHTSHLNEDIRSFSDPKKRKYLSSGDDVSSKTRSMEDLRNIRRQLSREGMPPPPLPRGGSRGQIASQVGSGSSLGLPVHVPVVSASRTSTSQGVALSSQLTDWPFTGPDRIDATRGQTATSAYFPKPHANRVYRCGSMDWKRDGPELPSVLSQRNAVYASNGNMNGASTLSRPRSSWTTKDDPVDLQTRATTHGRPRTHAITQSQNGHDGPQQLTKESLATLKEQLRQTATYSRHRNQRHTPPILKGIPSLSLDYSNLVKGRGILDSVAPGKAAPQSPMRNLYSQKNSIERAHDRGSSYSGESSSISDDTAYELPAFGRGPPYNASHEIGSIPRNVATPHSNAVNLISAPSKAIPGAINSTPVPQNLSSHRPLTGLSTAPSWLRRLSKLSSSASNLPTQRSAIQTTPNSQSYVPGWYSTQDRRSLVNTPNLQGQARLSIGAARGLVSRSSRWIVKKGTQSIRSLASRGPSVSSPFFKRDNIGTPRRPSPTMEESESYEVYQRFRTNDRPRTNANQRNIINGRSSASREASASRSAAIREHILGSSTPENFARSTPSLCRPFTPHVSPSIAILETSFSGSRMAPSSGRRVVKY
jgi:hypothetical protein